MQYEEIIDLIKSQSNPKAVVGMAKFGINVASAYGVSIPFLRSVAKKIGKKNHNLAEQLWSSGIHEARLLASMIDDPRSVTKDQMQTWVKDFDSWDICDQCCSNLFDKTKYAYQKAVEWSRGDNKNKEFVKRAGFVLMATLAVHDRKEKDSIFLRFLPIIKRQSKDERNFVRKVVNWALRQIGKRSLYLNRKAIHTAKDIEKIPSKSAKWIATNALRELTSETIQRKLSSRVPYAQLGLKRL
jgi:3-methyladenine DNA glycosylase AlkD